jgi:acyl carrier protein
MTANVTTPSRTEIATIVRGHIGAELGVDPSGLSDDTVLKDLAGADSVRLLRIVSKLERQLDTEFDDDDIFRSTTVGELVTLVHGYASAGV